MRLVNFIISVATSAALPIVVRTAFARTNTVYSTLLCPKARKEGVTWNGFGECALISFGCA